MHKILLMDTNISSSPIYNYLVSNNSNEVFVVGKNPDDFLAKITKNYINMDYSNIHEIRALVEFLDIEYIVPGCNDLSYRICAELNVGGQFFGLDTCEVTDTINNKEKFRIFSKKVGLPIPRVIPHDNLKNVWPLIVKPIDAYSGLGITIVQESERNRLPKAIKIAEEFSRSKTCIIEEYLEGQLFSHTAFISNGVILADFIVEEHSTANPFTVDTSFVVYDFPFEMLQMIREGILLLVKELKLVDGLVHTQFMKNADLFWFIEITRRCPGDLYSQLIESSTGFCYAEAYLKPFINQVPSLNISKRKQINILRHTISQSKASFFSSLKFKIPVQIENIFPLSLAGDMVEASPFSRIGLLFLIANSEKELNYLLQTVLKRELYSIQ